MTQKLTLFMGRTLYEQQTDHYDDEVLERLVHLDTAGAYAGRDAFLVMDRSRPELDGGPLAVEPIVSSVKAIVAPGSPLETGDVPATLVDAEWGGDVLMAVSARSIWRREDDGTWAEVYTEANDDKGDFRRIAYGSGTWMAIHARNGSSHPARVQRSTDDGDNWSVTALDHATNRMDPYSLAYYDGVWTVGGRFLFANEADGIAGTASSDDGGSSWVYEGAGDSHGLYPDLAVPGGDLPVWVTVDYLPPLGGRRADLYVSFDGKDWGLYWNPPPGGAVFDPGNGVRAYEYAWRVLNLQNGTFAVIHKGGRVSVGAMTPTPPGFLAAPFFGSALQQYTSLIESGGETVIHDAAYDMVGKAAIVTGQYTRDGGDTEPRVWSSTDGCKTWKRLLEVEAALATPATVVTVDGEGNAWYFNADTLVNAGSRVGLGSGSYNIYAISYINTPAGRLVYDLTRVTVTGDDGSTIKFRASGKDSIATDNTWADPYTIDQLRFDVYIQLVADAVGDEGIVPENTIRYAFTEPFPDAADGDDGLADLTRTIDELPLGRQVVSRGLPTTSVLERSLTALHNGRMWGMAHQDESKWHVEDDGISPEIANQANRFVLCYSETGWANLMSDQNFIPIQPTQSQNFTGLVSTPFGLLVMFDNEIHVVTGDPAFDNVTVELFTNLAGNDKGSKPCKVGGTPFVIWTGKIWALTGDGAQEVSVGQWLPDDPFVQIVPEPQTRSLLALTANNRVFRYAIDKQFWLTDTVCTFSGDDIELMLPNCVCVTGDNTRFVTATGAVFTTRRDLDQPPDPPYVAWNEMDFGSPEKRKAFHLLKATFQGEVADLIYDRDNPGFDPDAVPKMFYFTNNSIDGEALPILRYPSTLEARFTSVLAWRTKVGMAKSDTVSVHLRLVGMQMLDVLRLPVRFIFSAGGELR